MSDDFIVISGEPGFDSRMIWGASCLSSASVKELVPRFSAFTAAFKGTDHEPLFAWWCERLVAEGGIPRFKPDWWKLHAGYLERMFLRDRIADGSIIRLRYIGTEIERRRDKPQTEGELAHHIASEDAGTFWRRLALLFEEGRPRFYEGDMSALGRGFVRMTQLDLPLADPESGEIRYDIGLQVYRD